MSHLMPSCVELWNGIIHQLYDTTELKFSYDEYYTVKRRIELLTCSLGVLTSFLFVGRFKCLRMNYDLACIDREKYKA